jgi:hypothetical protein
VLLDDPGDDLAGPILVLLEGDLPLGFTQLLVDDVLRGLRGDATELGWRLDEAL